MASEKFEAYQAYYTSGKWNKEMIHKATERGHLTTAEYKTITNEDYVPVIYKYEGGNLTDLMEKHLITGDPNATSNSSSSNSSDSSGGSNEEPQIVVEYGEPNNTGTGGAGTYQDPEDNSGSGSEDPTDEAGTGSGTDNGGD